MKEKHESVIIVIITAVMVGGMGGTVIGLLGDAIISESLEVESKTEIKEHILFPAYQKSFSNQNGIYEYYFVINEEGEKRAKNYIQGEIRIKAEEGRKRPVLREITKTVGYKNPVNDFLFNSKKSAKITKEIILPKFF